MADEEQNKKEDNAPMSILDLQPPEAAPEPEPPVPDDDEGAPEGENLITDTGDDDGGEREFVDDEDGEKDEQVTDESAESDDQKPDEEVDEAPEALPGNLVAWAKEINLSDDEIENYQGKPEELEQVLTLYDRAIVAGEQKNAEQAEAEGAGEAEQVELKYEPIPLDEDGMDESIVTAFRDVEKIAHQAAPVIEQLQQQVQELTNHRIEQQEREFYANFDGQVGKLSDAWKELLGEGSTQSLPQTSPQLKNRHSLIQTMIYLQTGRTAKNAPALGYDDLFRRALLSEFGDQTKKEAQAQLAKQLKGRSRQHTNRPTRRREAIDDKPPTSSEEVVQKAMQDPELQEAASRVFG